MNLKKGNLTKNMIANVLSENNSKKTLSIAVDETLLEAMEKITVTFNKINTSKIFSKNGIIEIAIKSFIDETVDFIEEKYNINLNIETKDSLENLNIIAIKNDNTDTDDTEVEDGPNDENENGYNLAIYPARSDGFKTVFLGQSQWYDVRMDDQKINKIKYIALYQTKPTSGITYYAAVDKICISPNDSNKKIIYLKDKPIPLGKIVALGDTNSNAMRPPRYTSLNKLKNATVVADLF